MTDTLLSSLVPSAAPAGTTYTFNVSNLVGTTPVRLLASDPTRIYMKWFNPLDWRTSSTKITLLDGAGVPIEAAGGTMTFEPGIGFEWSLYTAPRGEIWAIAEAEDTPITGSIVNTSGTDPLLIDLLARFVTPPDSPRLALISDLFEVLRSSGLAATCDIHGIVGADQQCSYLNWFGPQVLTEQGGSPTFVADEYLQGDGAATYWDTGVTIPGRYFAKDDALMACWVSGTATGLSKYIMGYGAGVINPNRTGSSIGMMANANSIDPVTAGAGAGGMMAWVRNNSADFDVFFDGAYVTTVTRASASSVIARNLYLGCSNSAGGAATFNGLKLHAWYCGSAPPDPVSAVAALRNGWSDYLTGIGAI